MRQSFWKRLRMVLRMTPAAQLFEEIFAKYKEYGIIYKEAADSSGAGNVYYNGQLVNIFSDVTPTRGAFSFKSGKKGGINVRTVYNSDGEISGVKIVK